MEMQRLQQEREMRCLTTELFEIKQGVNTILSKIGEFTGSKLVVNDHRNQVLLLIVLYAE